MNNKTPKRGEIWLVEFDPSIGTEIQKTRPALVISNNISNENRTKVSLMPITSNVKKEYIFTLFVEPDSGNCLDKKSSVIIADIMTFDKLRLKNKIGELSKEKLKEVDKKLKLHLELN